jgi:hypothetical protein
MCPPPQVATELRGEANMASLHIAQYEVQLAEEEYGSRYTSIGPNWRRTLAL